MFDVRFLKNPHWVPALRPKTGKDPAVAAYIRRQPTARTAMKKLTSLLRWMVPLYVQEGKSYLTIAIGCTGGRHRSVYVAEALKRELSDLKGVSAKVVASRPGEDSDDRRRGGDARAAGHRAGQRRRDHRRRPAEFLLPCRSAGTRTSRTRATRSPPPSRRCKQPGGVLIATDMFGGTPSNLGITFLEQDKIEVVTGVNLPMLIKAASLKDRRVAHRHGAHAARARPQRDLGRIGSPWWRVRRTCAVAPSHLLHPRRRHDDARMRDSKPARACTPAPPRSSCTRRPATRRRSASAATARPWTGRASWASCCWPRRPAAP